GHLLTAGPDPPDPSGDGAVGGTPADHEHLGVGIGVVHLQEGDVVGDSGDPSGAQAAHAFVVGPVVGHVSAAVRLLQPADTVLEPRDAGGRPRTGQGVLVPDVGPEGLLAI